MAAEEKVAETEEKDAEVAEIYNATIYIVTNSMTPFNNLLIFKEPISPVMTYDHINIPLSILSLNKTIKETFGFIAAASARGPRLVAIHL
jgi:hypothetical protein